ncbi:MAG TPA: RNA polymerase sigma factor [Ktedonobacterales bacterium]
MVAVGHAMGGDVGDTRAGVGVDQGDDADALESLVERARSGDHAAFAALFERFNARIRAYLAHLLGDDELGRDLAQETFLAAWRALPGLHGGLRFAPWLYRIATNAARSHLRHQHVVRWLPWADAAADDSPLHPSAPGPDACAGEAELVAHALRTLAPQCRTCLLLQVEAGFSQREIAELLGIGEKSVSAYVSRGREQFRRAYRAAGALDAERATRDTP